MLQNGQTRDGLFITKWAAAERARAAPLRHAVVRPNVTGTFTGRVAHSKRAHAGLLVTIDEECGAESYFRGSAADATLLNL